jgi:hypothetical protein
LTGPYTLAFDRGDLCEVEKLALYSSGDAAAPNGYTLATIDATVAAGRTLTVIAQSLLAGETLVFNGSAEKDGSFNVRGGRGNDTIAAAPGRTRSGAIAAAAAAAQAPTP